MLSTIDINPALARQHEWLLPLLEGYTELEQVIKQDIARSNRKPACSKGCSFCCNHQIPVTSPEIMLISFYLNKAEYQAKESLPPPANCIFLKDGCCEIYPVRPIACRRYIVFGKQCKAGEMATETREQDVLQSSRHALLYILQKTIPFYIARGLLAKGGIPNIQFFAEQTFLLHQVDWKQLLAAKISPNNAESRAC